jgi:hypothetical protein
MHKNIDWISNGFLTTDIRLLLHWILLLLYLLLLSNRKN